MRHYPVRPLRDPSLFHPEALALFDELPEASKRDIAAVVLPHIYRGWGADTYRAAAAALRGSPRPDVVYIFGFKHHGRTGVLFHGTRRAYDLGGRRIEICQPTMDLLEASIGPELFQFERDHDSDWTIENAVPALYAGCGTFTTFVPILVDYQAGMFTTGNRNFGRTQAFLEAIAESISRHTRAGNRTLLAGAVDLSHIGHFFGDPVVTSARNRAVQRLDRRYLKHVFAMKPEQAENVIGDNPTRSDAPGPVGLILRILRTQDAARSGELIHYGVYHGRECDRWVSLAAGVFFKSRNS